MRVTNVILLEPKHKDNPELLHVVDVVLDNQLKIKDIELQKTNKGFFVKFPKSHYSGYEVYHTIDRELRNHIFKSIVDAYVRQ